MADSDWAQSFFERIAVPRLPGSAAVERVERDVSDRLESLGYSVRAEAFTTTPKRLLGTSAASAGFGWLALLIAPLMILPVPGWTVVLLAAAGIAFVIVLSVGIAEGHIPAPAPQMQATNLLAGSTDAPRVWLVSHSDSKAQLASMRGRILALLGGGLGFVTLMILLLARLQGPLSLAIVLPPVLVTAIGTAVLSLRPYQEGCPGAVDNATGLVAVLSAAERLRHRTDVGILITGAEEFGMHGARVFMGGAPRSGVFLNFDGVDSRGKFNLMTHAPRLGRVRVDSGDDVLRLHHAMARALKAGGYRVRRFPLPVGVFVDGSILAEGGLRGVTVSRGDWETLGVVHTPRDTADRTDVRSAVDAGVAAAAAIDAALG